MYTFQIIRTKYSRLTRQVSSAILILLVTVGIPTLTISLIDNGLALIILICFCVTLLLVLQKIIDKVYQIGTIEFGDNKLNVLTKDINKEIYIRDVDIIKLKAGTGGTKGAGGSATYIASIVLKDKQAFNIHLTRHWYKDNVKQKQLPWSKNIDLFNLLNKKGISWKFDRHIKEADCSMT